MKLLRFTFAWCVLAGATAAAQGAVVTSNIIAPRIEAIARNGFSAIDPALILVYVVDQDGDPLEGVEVRLTGTKAKPGGLTVVALPMQPDED